MQIQSGIGASVLDQHKAEGPAAGLGTLPGSPGLLSGVAVRRGRKGASRTEETTNQIAHAGQDWGIVLL